MAMKPSPKSYEFEPYATLADLTDVVAELNAAGLPDDAVVRCIGTVEFNRHGPRLVKLTVVPADNEPAPKGKHAA